MFLVLLQMSSFKNYQVVVTANNNTNQCFSLSTHIEETTAINIQKIMPAEGYF